MSTITKAELDILLAPKKRSKYGVRTDAAGKAARTVCGVLYDSKAEARYAEKLILMARAKEIYTWTRQVPIRLEVNGILVCKLVIDFRIIYPDGSTKLVEIKGFQTGEYKLKRKLFRAIYGYDFEVIHV